MVRIAVLGASGYTGLELLRLLARHPHADVTALASRQEDRPHLSEVHPSLAGVYDLRHEPLSTEQLCEKADCVFSCLPHGASAEMISPLVDQGLKVIDFSADYRLTDAAVYEKWYGVSHPDTPRLGATPYGLPELFRTRIRESNLVANPGCYPTSAVLALAPLLKSGVASPDGILIDSKSGVSGAGRNLKPNFQFFECNESVTAYSVGAHRHMPEIDQLLSGVAKTNLEVVFTPHLMPMDRGILSTCYATPSRQTTTEEVTGLLRDFYESEPFVHVTEQPPTTKQVSGTNRCLLYARTVRGRIVVVSVIDNLIKGAAGAAVQNFNLMHGFDERIALEPA